MSNYNALFHLLSCVAGPVKAGPKWVTYSREQVDAMIEVIKKMIEEETEGRE